MHKPFRMKEAIYWNEQEQDNYIMMAVETCMLSFKRWNQVHQKKHYPIRGTLQSSVIPKIN